MSNPGEIKVAKHCNERLLLLLLAAVQFTVTVDFLIIMPLGPQYMRLFHISPAQFGWMVSAYAISAGIFGLAASLFLDRMDRRTGLIGLNFGFTVGTLMCALAPTYHLLVLGRVVAGAFGGVVGALVLAIVGDVIPHERRGAAMGMVMSSFSAASILGVPLGLFLATHVNWHVPFFALAGLSGLLVLVTGWTMPSLTGHMTHGRDQHPVARILEVMAQRDHQLAFLFMAVLTGTSFLVFPEIANYMVSNVGLREDQLLWIYLVGGSFTIFSMNLIGRWADRSGKRRVFTIMSMLAVIPLLTVTNLPRVPLVLAITTTTVMMICMSGRFVPAMAMITGSIEAQYRGGFMSINSSVQQLSGGFAALVSGQVIGETPEHLLTHYNWVGYLSVTCALTCIWLAGFLKTPSGSEAVDAEVLAEAG